jgi:hypothetical protein
MTTVVWIMVMLGYGGGINTGPEFNSKEKCERAAAVVSQSLKDREGGLRPVWCVKIEK